MITIISSQDNEAGLAKLAELGGGEDRPESGLHPRYHADLAEGWIKKLREGEDIVVFTHAEGLIKCDEVKFLVYATAADVPAFVEVRTYMKYEDDAEFLDQWPCVGGFFRERGDELFHE